MKHLVSLLVLLCLTSFVYAGGNGQGAAIRTLVIDPGHGGMDPGAIGPGGHHEAELALAVSLKFGEMVHKMFPDVKIIYTRTTDKFVSLADRADIANKAKADLFICIHLNSATNHEAYGTSTYVLGLHRTDDNLEIAKRENAVIELEGDKDKNYEFDPNSPEGHIIMSMKQNAFLDQSILIASKIEDELALLSKRKSRGVKQAGFWVLYKTAMPSLLAEIGFISNPQEESYLSTADGQTNIATSIYKAFRAYKYQIEGNVDTSTDEAKIAFQKKTEKQADSAALKALQNPHPSQPISENKPPKTAEEVKPTAAKEKPHDPNPSSPSVNAQPTKKEEKVLTQEPATASKNTESPKSAPKDSMLAKVNEARMMNEARMKKDSAFAAKMKEKSKDSAAKEADVKFTPINQIAAAVKDTDMIVKDGKVTMKPEESKPKTEKKLVSVRDANGNTAKTAENKDNTPKKTAAKPDDQPKAKVDTLIKKTVKTEPKTAMAEPKETKPAAAVKKEEPKAKPDAENKPAASTKETIKPTAKADANVTFNVQLIAGMRKPSNYKELVNSFGVLHMEEIKGGVIRYMAGPYATYGEAEKAMVIAKKFGYDDAFIMAYQDGKRTTPQKTQELAKSHP